MVLLMTCKYLKNYYLVDENPFCSSVGVKYLQNQVL